MDTELSASAVAALRFEIKGWRPQDMSQRLASYRELAAAGIMERVPGSKAEYRFTEAGLVHREAILRREADRIERARHVIPEGVVLSEGAKALLRTCVAGENPEGDESNRQAYRELVEANIMMSVGTFTKGDECVFRFTSTGWERRFELAGIARAKESA